MAGYVGLIRAVNVGGTGTLPMAELASLCRQAGLADVSTVGASGNVVFRSDAGEDAVRRLLASGLLGFFGKDVGVLVRSASEIAGVVRRNPFAGEPGNRVTALFTDEGLPGEPLEGATGAGREQVRLGERELFVFYPEGMARTRLRLPSERHGTARNMNTVAKLAVMASAFGAV